MKLPSIEDLLAAGTHFGHQTRRWNPKMKRFILAEKNGIHVINLKKTLEGLAAAGEVVKKATTEGKSVLFVGTKVTARTAIQSAADKSGQYFVTKRWLGGMLTNFQTVKQSIRRMDRIDQMEREGLFQEMQKKEALVLNRERSKLEDVFSGIRHMRGLPGVVIVSDIAHEHLAVAEARRLNIPVIAICDSNVNPEKADYVIPGNDDAVKSVSIIVDYLAGNVEKKAVKADAKKPAPAKAKKPAKAATKA